MKTYKYLIISALLIWSCKIPDDKNVGVADEVASSEKELRQEAKNLLIKNCYICHSPSSPSHDEIIAPPLAAVKMRYGMRYSNEEDFVNAIVDWSLNPKGEKALMKGAVDRFNVMPKQPFKREELNKMALYMYQNELEEPIWFEEHQREMHQGKNISD